MLTSHRHYHNGRYLVTPLVAIVLLLSACAITPVAAPANGSQASSGAQSATQNPSNLPTIRVAMLPFISFAPFYIAQEEGFFTEQGLNVELVDIALQQDMIPSLASGQVDVSSGLLSAGIFNTVAQGGNIQIVADKGYVDPKGCPNLGLVARRGLIESGVGDNPQALQGLTLAVVRTTWLDYYAHKLFATAGVDMEQMHLTDIPSQAAPEALEQGTIDMIMQNEPWITRFAEAGHKMILTPVQELLPNSEYGVTLYGKRLLNDNPELGNRFMVAYLKAVQQYNEGKSDRNIGIMAKATGLDAKLLKQMCWPTLHDDGAINVQSVLDFQQWAEDQGFVKQAVTAEQVWNPSFIEQAKSQLQAKAP